MEFEGEEITGFELVIPAITLVDAGNYRRGTYLDLNLQVRVKGISVNEDRKENLVKRHAVAIENVTVTGVISPEDIQRVLAESVVTNELSPGDPEDRSNFEQPAESLEPEPDPDDGAFGDGWEPVTAQQPGRELAGAAV